jgi:hypothetical protein
MIYIFRIVSLSVFVFLAETAMALTSTPLQVEVHHYLETTGDNEKKVTWQLKKNDLFELTYISEDEQHTTTTGPHYDTRLWHVVADNGTTDFTAERMDRTIRLDGIFKGKPVDKKLSIDNLPWYQATSLSLRRLVKSKDRKESFWTIRFDTLTVHKIRAIKQEMVSIDSNSTRIEGVRIQLSLTGLLTPFWKSDYWFTLPKGVFFRFKGPSGPPGAPVITITQIN